ncbi:ParB/RepB/Spo0J family partition protein (plasmid) [Roseobacter denitrificans]|uniref:Plasmid stabilization protein, putative n=1 Tax=Roseobacter denitrificans (strain ATCC 33942 / OCh 114) TaxID=375451 RepID=Q07GM8_ROSDO|nr:ParB/RepB/Spo0J family partition protein [Roseobacter denitrificans]ABI93371.1 plasmid stabilization protein, putative [Roseobacter denitrificans OCh 114]AVL51258.1 ParB/RepB/Spo0J family partition protein [Roseobacter denitrificans]SFG47292.1 ParB family protein [Roseobacter denitrificans OCh 114]
MTKKSQSEMTQGTLKSLALSSLSLSPLNPRQEVPDEDVASLAESIKTVGLIQPIAGLETKDGVEIVAGGRRLRALRLAAADLGQDEATYLVNVTVTTDAAQAQSWASTENVNRKNLHPAQEVRAYADMIQSGSDESTVAKAFGVTVRHVKGRMKLAVLPTVILDALRADEITLDVAAAYTVADTTEQAAEVFERLNGGWMGDQLHSIRSELTQDAADGDGKLATFVGRAAYEAAGGAVTEDLFGEDVYFTDSEIVQQLADAKLAEAAEALKGEGWLWVETAYEQPSYEVTQKMGRAYAQPVAPSEDQQARYDALADIVETDTATEAEMAEFDALEEAMEQKAYTEDQKRLAGVFLYITYHGELGATYGMIRPENRKEAEDAGICAKNAHHTSYSAAEKPKSAYSAALTADLARVRTCAVQTALLDKPELALDLVTFALVQSMYDSPIGISTTQPRNTPDDDAGLTVDARIAHEYETPIRAKPAAEKFAAFRALPKKERNAALTGEVAKLMQATLADHAQNPLIEMVATLAGANVRAVWTPSEAFLNRLKADQLIEAMAFILGEAPQKSFTSLKKGEKAARLAAIFAGKKGIPPLSAEQKRRAEAWVPDGMATAPAVTPKTAKPAKAKKAAA